MYRIEWWGVITRLKNNEHVIFSALKVQISCSMVITIIVINICVKTICYILCGLREKCNIYDV